MLWDILLYLNLAHAACATLLVNIDGFIDSSIQPAQVDAHIMVSMPGLQSFRLQKRAPVRETTHTDSSRNIDIDKGKQQSQEQVAASKEHIDIGAGRKRKHEDLDASTSSSSAAVPSEEPVKIEGAKEQRRSVEELQKEYRHHRNRATQVLNEANLLKYGGSEHIRRVASTHFQSGLFAIGNADTKAAYELFKGGEAWREKAPNFRPEFELKVPLTRWGKSFDWYRVPERSSDLHLTSRISSKLAKHRSLSGKSSHVTRLQRGIESSREKLQGHETEINRIKTEIERVNSKDHTDGLQSLNEGEREASFRQLEQSLGKANKESLAAQKLIQAKDTKIEEILQKRKGAKEKHLKPIAKYTAQHQIVKDGDVMKMQEMADHYFQKAEERGKVPEQGPLAYKSIEKLHLWNQNIGRVMRDMKAAQGGGIGGRASTSTGLQRQTVQEEIEGIKNWLTPENLQGRAHAHLNQAEKIRRALKGVGKEKEIIKKQKMQVENEREDPDRKLAYQLWQRYNTYPNMQ